MHRLIVTSADLSPVVAAGPDGARSATPATACSGGRPRSRLEAEMVRDAMLAVSGMLDPKLGGPELPRPRARQGARARRPILYAAVDPSTPGLDRRTLYRAWARGGRSAFLDAFDCPDPSTTAPRRPVTTTPLQALALMNNALVLHLSDAFAARLRREAGADAGAAGRAGLSPGLRPAARAPTSGRGPRAWSSDSAPATLARAIFNSNEFLYVD